MHASYKLILATIQFIVPLVCLARCPFASQFVVAHRGYCGQFPDQSLGAYEGSLLYDSSQFIECDLQITSDNVLICNHDANMLNTTDVERHAIHKSRRRTYFIDGDVHEGYFTKDFTLQEIKEIRQVQRFSFREQVYNGIYPIMSLEEVIDFSISSSQNGSQHMSSHCSKFHSLNPSIGLYVETKHPSWYKSVGFDMTAIFLDVLRRRGYLEKAPPTPIIIQSFEAWNLREIRSTVGDLVPLTMLVQNALSDKYGVVYDRKRADATSSDEDAFNLELVEADLKWVAQFANAVAPDKSLIAPLSTNLGITSMEKAMDYVSEARALGLEIHPYTFRDEPRFVLPVFNGDPLKELSFYYDTLEVDAVFSDHPLTAAKYLRSKVDSKTPSASLDDVLAYHWCVSGSDKV